MSDAYWLHIEVHDLAAPPHGIVHGYEPVNVYATIAGRAAEQTVRSAKATITTVAKRPDGRVIILRRLWTGADEPEGVSDDQEVLDAACDEQSGADEAARDVGGGEG